MSAREKLYGLLCALFSTLSVFGNLTYQKFVSFKLPFFGNFYVSVGVLLYPLTFLLTDLITEFFGKERARFCVRCGVAMNFTVGAVLILMRALPATPWSRVDDATFSLVFGAYGIGFLGSIVACVVSQRVDVFLYAALREWTQGKHLWLRSNGSSCVSLLIDTLTVLTILTCCSLVPVTSFVEIAWSSYRWKFLFIISSTPLFYLWVWGIRVWLGIAPLPLKPHGEHEY